MQRPLYGPLQWGAEIAGLIILLSLLSYIALQWGDLPEKIPTHYNFSGQADAWGSKSALLYLLGGAIFTWIVLTVVSFFPSLWNYPVKVTPANAQFLYLCSLNLLVLLKLELLILFSSIIYFAINEQNLPVWLTPIALAVIFASVLFPIWRMYRLGKYV
jgi:uncharacterized membrane protein